MENKYTSNSANINPRELGYYSYEEAAAVLQISLRSVDNYCKKYNVKPKTGIIDNRKKFLTRKDIVDLFIRKNEKKTSNLDISAINWSIIEEDFSAKKDAEKEKLQTEESISAKPQKEQEAIDIDFKEHKTEEKYDIELKSKQQEYWDDYFALNKKSGKQEMIIEHQSESISKLSKKVLTSRIFIWAITLISIIALYKISEIIIKKEQNIAEIKNILQKKDSENYKLGLSNEFAEKQLKHAENNNSELQKLTIEYKTILKEKEKEIFALNRKIDEVQVENDPKKEESEF